MRQTHLTVLCLDKVHTVKQNRPFLTHALLDTLMQDKKALQGFKEVWHDKEGVESIKDLMQDEKFRECALSMLKNKECVEQAILSLKDPKVLQALKEVLNNKEYIEDIKNLMHDKSFPRRKLQSDAVNTLECIGVGAPFVIMFGLIFYCKGGCEICGCPAPAGCNE